MLSKPVDGWSELSLFGHSATLSYLEDYPMELPLLFLHASGRISVGDGFGEALADEYIGSVRLDAEGYWETLIAEPAAEDGMHVSIVEYDGEGEDDKVLVSRFIGKDEAARLMCELASDIEAHVHEWAFHWTECEGLEEYGDNDGLCEEREQELLFLVDALRRQKGGAQCGL